MNDLQEISRQLPDTLEDLTQFVLVGKAKLQAYMLKIRTVDKLTTAQEIRDQTLREAQEISTALIAAEQRIGELLLAIPKQSGGDRKSEDFKIPDAWNFEKSKSETISEMGYTKHEVSDYQRMAQNPEIVQKVIESALDRGEVVTKTAVMKEIKAVKAERDQEVERLNKKLQKQYDERNKLLEKIEELQQTTQEGLEAGNLSENVFYFCQIANNFVGNVGGLVWLTERIDDMPGREKELFLKAARALNDFSLAFIQNMERNGYGQKFDN